MANECPLYLEWIRQQACLACGHNPAGEAHHTGRSGMGQRPDDAQAVPLCHACHMALHDLRGPFRGFERRHVKAWEGMAVEVTWLRAGVTVNVRLRGTNVREFENRLRAALEPPDETA